MIADFYINNAKLNVLLCADYQVMIAGNEDDRHRDIYKLNGIVHFHVILFNTKMPSDKTKALAYKGKDTRTEQLRGSSGHSVTKNDSQRLVINTTGRTCKH
jgi:hypothetical protein